MAFTPQQQQQYRNVNENNTDNDNNNNNNRRVQFSIYAKNTQNASLNSMPNANPLTAEESMPYQPDLEEYNHSTQCLMNIIKNPTQPTLSHDLKSVEINNNNKGAFRNNSNNSTPESINLNEPIPSKHDHYDSKSVHIKDENRLSFNKANSILVNPQVLVNQESQLVDNISDEKTSNMNSKISKQNSKQMLPITSNSNHNHNNNMHNHNHNDTNATQQYDIYRQQTMPRTNSYDAVPALYSTTSQQQKRNNNKPPLPNDTSIALSANDSNTIVNDTVSISNAKELTYNQSIPAQTQITTNNSRRKLSLNKDFSNDKQAFETWMACCDITDDTFGYYSALYPLLCEIFAENTKCSRVPKQCDLEEVIMKHGAKKMKISKLHNMHHLSHLSCTISSDMLNGIHKKKDAITPPESPGQKNSKHLATVSTGLGSGHSGHNMFNGVSGTISFDFDNPNDKPKYLVTIKYKSFFKFWKWFQECCKIIKELSHLWDANNQSALQCNLFCGREESQHILDMAPQGTFMLRLSSVIKGGIVLSYVEPSFSKKDKHFKHTILIRRTEYQYELRSSMKKQSKKANHKAKQKLTTISALVRSFVKIKFLYTPYNLYPKKSVF